jgi:hypothetical protein
MHEPQASSGSAIGWIAVMLGILGLGLGFGYVWQGQGSEGVGGFVFGGVAFIAGCVILQRHAQMVRNKQAGPGRVEPDA